MKTQVNPDTCIGCGLCVDVCSEVYEMNDDGVAVAKVALIPDNAVAQCREAADSCPVDAIAIED